MWQRKAVVTKIHFHQFDSPALCFFPCDISDYVILYCFLLNNTKAYFLKFEIYLTRLERHFLDVITLMNGVNAFQKQIECKILVVEVSDFNQVIGVGLDYVS